MSINYLEAQLRQVLDRVSNNESVVLDDTWIEEAGEQFKTALRKQFTPRPPEFRIRMSNIGRPLCQLQMEKAGMEAQRMPYNHVLRMLVGDATEVFVRLLLKIAKVNVTSEGDSVRLPVATETIKGDSDLDIDGKVYDVKSCSEWAFKNKWSQGYDGMKTGDDFGYIGQLFGYADAQQKPAGGWVVVNKSSGEIRVVDATPTEEEQRAIRQERHDVVVAITTDKPFARMFTAQEELFRGKPTGAIKINDSCTRCKFMQACWPTAKFMKHPRSEAKNPPYNWYTQYPVVVDAD